MGKKNILLFFILAGLLTLSGAYIAGGVQAYSQFQQNTLEQQEHCGGEAPVHICVQSPRAIFSAFYPSYIAAQFPLFNVSYRSATPLTLVVSVSISHFSQMQTRTVNATSTMQNSTFIPPLPDSSALQKLTAEAPAQIQVQVSDTRNRLYYRDDIPLVLHSRWLMQWVTAHRLNIGAWVTPNNAAVAALVAKASTRLNEQQAPVPQGMIGYHNATPRQVIDQVDAIYDALRQDYHIRYVQASVPYNAAGDDNAATQIIKLPQEVLQQRSGMCIELTALLASAAEHIGLHTQIIIIPGHAFLGVATGEDGKQIEYWDASSLNNNVAADSANVQANQLYLQHLKQRSIIDIINVSEARKAHIGPML